MSMDQPPRSIGAMPRVNRGIIFLLAAIVIWGSTFVVTKALLAQLGPFTLTAARFLIAFAVLIPLAYRESYQPRLILRPSFLLYGLTGIALFYGLQNLGLTFTSASTAALIQASIPALTTALSVLVLRERPGVFQLAGIALAVIGVGMVSLADAGTAEPHSSLYGSLLLSGSALAWAVYTIQGRRLTQHYPAAVSTTACIGAGLLWLVPFAAGELWATGLPALDAGSTLAILYLGCVASALSFYLWNEALRTVPASVAAPYVNLIPVVAVISAVALGEQVSLLQLGGGSVALLGVWLSSRQG